MQVPHSTQDVMVGFFLVLFLVFLTEVDTTDSCHTVCLPREQQANYMTIKYHSHIAKLNLVSLVFLINSSLEAVLRLH